MTRAETKRRHRALMQRLRANAALFQARMDALTALPDLHAARECFAALDAGTLLFEAARELVDHHFGAEPSEVAR